jgi:predicted nucleic acid-binding protein
LIFIDSNVPMYLVGAPHPHKEDSERLLERCVEENQRLVTDAEVFQEILHRFVAMDRRDAIQPAFDVLLAIADEVFPVDLPIVERAKTIVFGNELLSARDALHLAVMQRQGVDRILSFDRAFDGFPGVERIGA